MSFECCLNCCPPKRHPGCHGSCPEYMGQKAMHDEQKAASDRKKFIKQRLQSQMYDGVHKAYKRRKVKR